MPDSPLSDTSQPDTSLPETSLPDPNLSDAPALLKTDVNPPAAIVGDALTGASHPASPIIPSVPGDSARSLETFHRSQTFLARSPAPMVFILRYAAIVVLAVVFFFVIPILNAQGVIPDYKLNNLGKYLSLTLVALGIDLIWGYTGILSLCQAMFFCLGAYAISMHLSLPQGGGDVRPEYNNIPQFMFFNNVRVLPWFWKPFGSMAFSLLAGLAAPGIVAAVFGFFVFRSRVRGVYFSIVTQAVAWGTWLMISRNEMLLGGTNGLTNFYKPLTESRRWILALYLTTLVVIVLSYLLCRAITRSRLGRVMVAVRDKETRLYFAGYRPYAFKVFAFAVAGMLAGVGGMLYAPQTGIVTPQNMNVQASIEMVIWVALGGRGKLWGAVFGTLLVNYAANSLNSDMPTLWPFVEGGMFVAVVLFFPDGVAGLWTAVERRLNARAAVWRSAGTLIAIVALGLFILGQSLGLLPHWFFTDLYTSEKIGHVQWKYVVLLAILLACGLFQKWIDHQEKRAAAVVIDDEPLGVGREMPAT